MRQMPPVEAKIFQNFSGGMPPDPPTQVMLSTAQKHFDWVACMIVVI